MRWVKRRFRHSNGAHFLCPLLLLNVRKKKAKPSTQVTKETMHRPARFSGAGPMLAETRAGNRGLQDTHPEMPQNLRASHPRRSQRHRVSKAALQMIMPADFLNLTMVTYFKSCFTTLNYKIMLQQIPPPLVTSFVASRHRNRSFAAASTASDWLEN